MAPGTQPYQGLILAGAIAAFIFGAFWVTVGVVAEIATEEFEDFINDGRLGLLTFFIYIQAEFWFILGPVNLLWGALSFAAWWKIRGGNVRGGAMLATIVGALMMMFGTGLPGLLVLVPGAILLSRPRQVHNPAPPLPRAP